VRGIDLATVWAEMHALIWLELATLVAIAGWNLCTYAWVRCSMPPRRRPPQLQLASRGRLTGFGIACAQPMLERG
jgi:hypothetical protein